MKESPDREDHVKQQKAWPRAKCTKPGFFTVLLLDS